MVDLLLYKNYGSIMMMSKRYLKDLTATSGKNNHIER